MDRNLALEVVRVTEAAALASSKWMGRGDEKQADSAAVEAMRKTFDSIGIRGTVVIGEGERDEAPMLYIGEEVGSWSENDPEVDIALDPLEGTTITAQGGPNALSVIAIAAKGGFLHAPDTYMEKIAVGPDLKGKVSLLNSVTENLNIIREVRNCSFDEITAVILNRSRHKDLVEEVRKVGARIKLIGDGDVSAAISTAEKDSGIDVLFGTGGAPEGVIAAAALQCLGGEIQSRLCFRNEEEKERAQTMGIQDLEKVYRIEDLARGEDIMFAATGVTDGDMLKGIKYSKGKAKTHSMVMRKKSGTIRRIEATHNLLRMPKV